MQSVVGALTQARGARDCAEGTQQHDNQQHPRRPHVDCGAQVPLPGSLSIQLLGRHVHWRPVQVRGAAIYLVAAGIAERLREQGYRSDAAPNVSKHVLPLLPLLRESEIT